MDFKAKNLGIDMFRNLAQYIFDNKIDIKSKDEIKILEEHAQFDNLTTIYPNDSKLVNRLINKNQRRASIAKKVASKIKKNSLRVITDKIY